MKKVLALMVISLTVLSGCDIGNQLDRNEQVMENEKLELRDNSVELPKIENSSRKFNNKSGQFLRLDKELSSYTIDIRIKSAERMSATEFTDTSPPMPALIGGISINQGVESYFVAVPGVGQSIRIGNPDAWSRITLVCDTNEFSYYVNGLFEGFLESCPVLSTDVRIGRGYSQRFWTGDMEFFNIYSGNQSSALFSNKNDEAKKFIVLSLDNLK